jgi:hypothetical protein
VTISQDLVEHKYWGVDVADVESTGRNSMQIEAVIPFVNGIVPGKGERWGVLYPETFRKFLKAFADRSRGNFVHPELDVIICKPVSLDFEHDAQRRDGVIVTARWIETLENAESAFDVRSPIQEVALAALDLDAGTADIRGLTDEFLPPQFEESFDTSINKLAGEIDRFTISVQLAAARPGQILNRVRQVEGAVERARTALTWPITDACERMKEGVSRLPEALQGPRKVGRYVTKARATLAGILSALPVSVKAVVAFVDAYGVVARERALAMVS